MLRSAPSSDAASARRFTSSDYPACHSKLDLLDDTSTAWQESSDDPGEAVDQLFASLDEGDLLAEVGLFSLLV